MRMDRVSCSWWSEVRRRYFQRYLECKERISDLSARWTWLRSRRSTVMTKVILSVTSLPADWVSGDCLGVDLNRNFPSGWGKGHPDFVLESTQPWSSVYKGSHRKSPHHQDLNHGLTSAISEPESKAVHKHLKTIIKNVTLGKVGKSGTSKLFLLNCHLLELLSLINWVN